MLTADHRDRFARALRISPQLADQLTFRPLADRCPPVADALTRPGDPQNLRPRGYFPPWISGASTRYCPHCLAGDGSEIQRRHAGAWKLQWRLGMVFLCPQHQVFLQHLCPACRMPVHCGKPGSTLKLVTSATINGLHPSQCRNITGSRAADLCRERLDAPPHHTTPQPSTHIIRLQQHILGQLHPSRPAAAAMMSLADLQVMSALISATWPAAATVTADSHLASALDDHLHEQGRHETNATHVARSHLWATPPSSATATAGLLDISSRLLSLPDAALHEALRLLLLNAPEQRATGWGNTWLLLKRRSSRTLREQIGRATPATFTASRRRLRAVHEQARPILIRGQAAYRAEHIPQWLPNEWFTALVPHPNARERAQALRRFAAVQLVRTASDMSFEEAVRFLGIPDHWHGPKRRGRKLHTISRYIYQRPDGLEAGFAALNQHVSAVSHVVDYRSRRLRFSEWALSTGEWHRLASLLPRRNSNRNGLYPDDLLRAGASKFVWTHLTGSEWSLAPTPVPGPTDPREERLRQLLQTPSGPARLPYYRALKATLLDYAARLVGAQAA